MQSFKPTILSLLIVSIVACQKTPPPQPDPPQLIPQVAAIEENEGLFEINEETIIGVENEAQQKIATSFFQHFKKVVDWQPRVVIGKKGTIQFRSKETLGPEAYELNIHPDSIHIYASAGAGFFYALQSIRQLLPIEFVGGKLQEDVRWVLPAVSIKDQPRFAWRGFMLDVSRHFFEKEQVKAFLDEMAALKLNTFHWHLTDDQGWRIEIQKYPKLTEVGAWRVDYNDHNENHNRWWGRPAQKEGDKATYGGYYTQDDVREIIAYAQERFITVVPEIDMPGHSQAIIASYPEVACHPGSYFVATGGVYKDNTVCPGKEVSFALIEEVLNEVMDLFPSKYIHIGGDECNKLAWKADPDCQRRIKEEGLKNESELQSYFIKRVEKIINARGKSMIGWDEILEGGLAPKATVMSWRGEAGGIEAASKGHAVIMTPNKYCYLDLKQGHTDHEPNLGYSQCLLSTCYGYNPVPENLKDKSDFILGIQGNLWSESLPQWDMATYMAFPRLFAVAENAWSPQEKEDWDDFINRLYPQLERLEAKGIRYANSAFNVWINHKGDGNKITVDLFTEANGLEIRYTVDGKEPTYDSPIYEAPFELLETANVKAAAFKHGKRIGKITQKAFYVHNARGAKVVYHTPFLKNKSAGGESALTDLNFGSNWSVDSLWQGFQAPKIEVDVILDTLQEVGEVHLNFLQIAISGIYMPEQIRIFGTRDKEPFSVLAEKNLDYQAKVQGRYIQNASIQFPKTMVDKLKIELQSVNPIYEGHHRQGELSKVYLDEIVVY